MQKKANQLEREIKAAVATGNIGAVVKLIAETSAQTPTDFIKKTVGSLFFFYYTYIQFFHTRPLDIDDMVDGALYIEARNYQEEQARRKARQQAEKR